MDGSWWVGRRESSTGPEDSGRTSAPGQYRQVGVGEEGDGEGPTEVGRRT